MKNKEIAARLILAGQEELGLALLDGWIWGGKCSEGLETEYHIECPRCGLHWARDNLNTLRKSVANHGIKCS